MRLPINDQYQPRPYLTPFSHSISVTENGQTNRQTEDNHNNSSIVTKVRLAKNAIRELKFDLLLY